MNYNRVILMGRITRDIDVRSLPSNTTVAGFGLAVNETWKDRDGNKQEKTMFVDCSAFGPRGELMGKYLGKGSPVHIEGRLQLDQWEDKDGNKRSKHKIVVDGFSFVGPSGERSDAPAPSRAGTKPAGYQALPDDDIPF